MDMTIGELSIEIRETMEIMADAIQYIATTNATVIIEADDIDAAIELRNARNTVNDCKRRLGQLRAMLAKLN